MNKKNTYIKFLKIGIPMLGIGVGLTVTGIELWSKSYISPVFEMTGIGMLATGLVTSLISAGLIANSSTELLINAITVGELTDEQKLKNSNFTTREKVENTKNSENFNTTRITEIREKLLNLVLKVDNNQLMNKN